MAVKQEDREARNYLIGRIQEKIRLMTVAMRASGLDPNQPFRSDLGVAWYNYCLTMARVIPDADAPLLEQVSVGMDRVIGLIPMVTREEDLAT